MQNLKHKARNPLMQALNFSEDDLAANRDGRLSKVQHDYLVSQQSMTNTWIVRAALTGGSLIAVLLFLGSLVPGLIVAVLLAIITRWLVSERQTCVRDLGADVRKAEGTVQLDWDNETGLTLSIGGRQFKIQKEVFLAFKNGDPYSIYYAPNSKTILSAEWLYDEHYVENGQ